MTTQITCALGRHALICDYYRANTPAGQAPSCRRHFLLYGPMLWASLSADLVRPVAPGRALSLPTTLGQPKASVRVEGKPWIPRNFPQKAVGVGEVASVSAVVRVCAGFENSAASGLRLCQHAVNVLLEWFACF